MSEGVSQELAPFQVLTNPRSLFHGTAKGAVFLLHTAEGKQHDVVDSA